MADDEDNKRCQICFDGDEVGNTLIRPCLCRYIHRNCLDTWRSTNINNSFMRCEVCNYQYRTSRVWIGRLLAHKATAWISAILLTSVGGLLTGYGSSALYNSLWYWFHHQVYHSPHRLQVVFHSLFWTSIPGFYYLLSLPRQIADALPNADQASRIPWEDILRIWSYRNNISRVDHYHHHEEVKEAKHRERERERELDEDKQENKEKKEKRKVEVARYEEKSTIAWMTVLIGAVSSLYFTYSVVHQKCLQLSLRFQSYIENVG